MLATSPSGLAPDNHDATSRLAHLRERVREKQCPAASDWSVRFGRCEVNTASREVLIDGTVRQLQPLAFNLLAYLIEHRERVVTIDELLDEIWQGICVQPGALAAAVYRVRKALAVSGTDLGQSIRTHSRVGYRFVAALDAQA